MPKQASQSLATILASIGDHWRSRRAILLWSALVLLVVFGGCLIYETVEYRVTLNPDGKGGTITITYSNIASSSDEPAKQTEDFQELMDKWKGDKYLLERMNEGVYIKQRDLKLAKGILRWKEVGIFSDLQKMKDGLSYEDSTHITMGKDEVVLSTNGTLLINKDSTVVAWPPHTREFQIKIQNRDFKPTSNFAQKFIDLRKK